MIEGKFTVHMQNDLEFRMKSEERISIDEGLAVMIRFIWSQCKQYDIEFTDVCELAAAGESIQEKFTPITDQQYGIDKTIRQTN